MEFCEKCGKELREGAKFCPGCGQQVEKMQPIPINNNFVQPVQKENNSEPNKFPQNTIHIIIGVMSGIIVLLVIAITIFWSAGKNKIEYSGTEISSEVAGTSEKVIPEKNAGTDRIEALEASINSFINNYADQSNVSVAVFDNLTEELYQSKYANATYTAWGFYLPIYLAYTQYPYLDNTVRDGIMSNNASIGNENANFAIEEMGGLATVTGYLERQFNVYNTTYGRYFADVHATSDNYTTATDAIIFLEHLNNIADYKKLTYNTNSFGITAPASAMLYAQVGTENRDVRDSLNLFAIVKGDHADYCVAILTRNGNGRYISQLLQTIHTIMEEG